jgi:hypothetical protein
MTNDNVDEFRLKFSALISIVRTVAEYTTMLPASKEADRVQALAFIASEKADEVEAAMDMLSQAEDLQLALTA